MALMGIQFSDLPAILVGIIAFFFAIRMWQFIARESKSAVSEGFFGKLNYTFSAVLFIVTSTLVMTFISALVISSIAINILFAIQEKKLVYIDAMAKPWQFSQLIPYSLMILTILAVLYVLVEYFAFSKRSIEAPMEIQQILEKKVVKKAQFPFTIIVSLLLFIGIMIIPPLLLSQFTIYLNQNPSSPIGQLLNYSADIEYFFPDNWQLWERIMVFIAFIMLGPTVYLTYYSTLGNSQVLFKSVQVLKTPKYLRKFRHWGTIFLLILGILSLSSSIYSLIKGFPMLWGVYGDLTTSYKDLEGGFLETIIINIMEQGFNLDQISIDNFKYFTSIIPLDFVLFMITTVGFGLLGFSSDFLKKEPLNRPLLVKFATYVLIGIAFNTFIKVLTTWPWILPEDYVFLTLEFSDPRFQPAILFFFGPLVVIQNILTLIFLGYNIFGNKEMRYQINFNILNQAIKNSDYTTLEHFSRDSNLDLRLMVANTVIEEIQDKIKEKQKSEENVVDSIDPELMNIIKNLTMDENATVHKKAFKIFNLLIDNYKKDVIFPVIQNLLTDKRVLEGNLTDFEKGILKFNENNPDDVKELFNYIFKSNLTPDGVNFLLRIIRKFPQSLQALLPDIVIPLIQSKNQFLQIGGLQIINTLPSLFSSQLDEIMNIILGNIAQGKEQLQEKMIITGAKIVSEKPELMDIYFSKVNLGVLSENQSKLVFLSSIIQLMGDHPAKFVPLNNQIKELFSTTDKALQQNISISFGSIFTVTSVQQYLLHFHPSALQISLSTDAVTLENLLSSMQMIQKINPSIEENKQYIRVLFNILGNATFEIRKRVFQFLRELKFRSIKENIQDNLNQIDANSSTLKSKHAENLIEWCVYAQDIVVNQMKDFEFSDIYPTLLKIKWKEVKYHEALAEIFERGAKISFSFYSLFVQQIKSDKILPTDSLTARIFRIKHNYTIKMLENSRDTQEGKNIFNFDPTSIKNPRLLESIRNSVKEMQVECDPDKMKQELNQHLSSNSSVILSSALQFLSELLQFHPSIHSEYYPKLIELSIKSHQSIQQLLIKIFGQMVHIDPQHYLLPNPKKYKKKNRYLPQFWSFEVLPLIINSIPTSKPEEIKSYTKLMTYVFNKSQKAPYLREFLIKSMKSNKNPDFIVANLILLKTIPDLNHDSHIYALLLNKIHNQDEKVQSIAISFLADLILQSEKTLRKQNEDLSESKKKTKTKANAKRMTKKVLDKQINQFFGIKISKLSSMALKKEYLANMQKISRLQPELTTVLSKLSPFIKVRDANLSEIALNIAFKSILSQPNEIIKGLRFYNNYVAIPERSTKTLLVTHLKRMYEDIILVLPKSQKKEKAFAQLFITLYRFAFIAEKNVQITIHKVIETLFMDHPEFLTNFSTYFLRLFDLDYRSNSFNFIGIYLRVFFSHFDIMRAKEAKLQITNLIYRFSRFGNDEFALESYEYLPKILEEYPQKSNTLLGIAYNYCSISNPKVLRKTFALLDTIIEKNPSKRQSIVKNLEKIEAKIQSVAIKDYLGILKEKEKDKENKKEKKPSYT
ncbi:MAG: hypothetical protein ACTSYI_05160 [Promethearchaeota archaeon]